MPASENSPPNWKEYPETVFPSEEARAAYQKAREEILAAVENSQVWKPVTSLSLSRSGLVALPPEIGRLTTLVRLDLSGNQLTALPPEIGQLTSLSELNLDGNKITVLPPEIGRLTALTRLFLDRNQLASLPPQIGQLLTLSQLSLYRNQLTTLPPEIGLLTALTGLSLYGNQLEKLPPEMGQLRSLTGLDLHENPKLHLPIEVLGPTWQDVIDGAQPAAPHAILEHYFARIYQGDRPLNEARLVLVGRGGAGKTSMVQRLVLDKFNPQEDSTAGIALSDWKLRDCAGGPVTVHVWDFAGQVITHSMHRYFLSHRTVYVLVLTAREDSAEEDAEYWLRLIQSYGTDAAAGAGPPVLVALNKSDAAAVKLDRGALRERFPFIVGFVETDCASGRGIAELRRAFCDVLEREEVKKWVREGYPAQWWQLKERLYKEQQARPHLTYAEFAKLCTECGVPDARQAGVSLHTMGLALNYGLDSRWKEVLADTTVLSPSWVTHHCYNLIRHAETHAGLLYRAELESMLSPDRGGVKGEPDPALHLYLMRLMERFEAAYPLGDDWPPAQWLVPLGLPDSQPAGVETFRYVPVPDAARLRYTYPSVPPGLVAQFIVRTHPLVEAGMQWAKGAVLSLNGARALVRAISKTKVEVTAVGENKDARRDLAGLCRENLLTLHQQIGGMEVKETTEVEADGEVVWVSVNTLVKDEEKGKDQTAVATEEGSVMVGTEKELDEFGTKEGRLVEASFMDGVRLAGSKEIISEEDLENWIRRHRSKPKPRLFISYSHKDERLRKTLELYLDVLKIQGLVHNVWHDRRIQPGIDWDAEIARELTEANVVLLLVSTAFLASDYIQTEELRPALDRHLAKEARVVPIILERCSWVDTFAAVPPLCELSKPERRVIQGIPRDGKTIRSFSPQSDGWHVVAEELKSVLTTVKGGLNQPRVPT